MPCFLSSLLCELSVALYITMALPLGPSLHSTKVYQALPTCCQPCRYLVVGGGDKKLHIWDAKSHQYIRSLSGTTGHKDVITGLAFRDGTHELFSCGADRAVKIWSLDDMAYVDTLFGHQSEVCVFWW